MPLSLKDENGTETVFRCAPNDDYCKEDEYFEPMPDSDVCFCKGEKEDGQFLSGGSTLYGACLDPTEADNRKCAYSEEYCEDNRNWLKPGEIDTPCPCEEVRIGGCIGSDDEFHCAISHQDCDDVNDFIFPRRLELDHSHVCYLCHSDNPTKTTSVQKELDTKDDDDSTEKTGVIISVITCTFAVLALVAFVVRRRMRIKDSDAESAGISDDQDIRARTDATIT